MPEPQRFPEFVNLLRTRLGRKDAITDPGTMHSFQELMSDYVGVTPQNWYWEAFETLELHGHLHEQSTKMNLGDRSPDSRPRAASTYARSASCSSKVAAHCAEISRSAPGSAPDAHSRHPRHT